MADFESRYQALNPRQQEAVDRIDGPLLVIAGPGTGKTELLSMRAAAILKRTDTSPESILCLTFTDSGANAMRERLAQIIGADAYKVTIHTFHSFGTEIINQNREYFYRGASFKPADELSSHELLTEIFSELDYQHPLAGRHNHSFVYLSDVQRAISELKQAGLTSQELLQVINANETVLNLVESDLTQIFSGRISTTTLTLLAPLAERLANFSPPPIPTGIPPLNNILALSMAHAFDQAIESGKTVPITAWRNRWLEKDVSGNYVFKDRKRYQKLRELSRIYDRYLGRMESEGLFDYDDMILSVVRATEQHPDLRANLQEKYQYIMVDEFQDTNLAQLRILFSLTDSPANNGAPNVMAVGDDDQAIYSFQGADINNIRSFREHYPATQIVNLVDNYRSAPSVLSHAREVITQGGGRLEGLIESLDKTLTPRHEPAESSVTLSEYASVQDERASVARRIANKIANGVRPETITVIARTHQELVELLPYLAHHSIAVNYEKRDNVLTNEVVVIAELLAEVIVALQESRHDIADAMLPELLAHPAFNISAHTLWKLSLQTYRNNQNWTETMVTIPETEAVGTWLIELTRTSYHEPLERVIDIIIGSPDSMRIADYRSPIFEHFFSHDRLADAPDRYLTTLEAFRTIRARLYDYRPNEDLRLVDFLEFIQLHRDLGSGLTSVHRASDSQAGAINLMTAHKSKGLEFDHVYIVGAVDSTWGEKVRSRSRLISYPENLQITPASNTPDERIRLFFVAMTRAKNHLAISYATHNALGKPLSPVGFLVGSSLDTEPQPASTDLQHQIAHAELDWRGRLSEHPSPEMKTLLAPKLETYKLSATHLNTFIDITRGGPQAFLLNHLLHFPQAKSPHASYGTAVHAALHHAHSYLTVHGTRRPIEDILGDFTAELKRAHLSEEDFAVYSRRGADALSAFLDARYDQFREGQKTELSFGGQGSMVAAARLTGTLDLVDVHDDQIAITDYKTGKPSRDWKGATDAEKIKLHKYKQQLMFYRLLVETSREYRRYTFAGGCLQFVEPDTGGTIHQLDASFTDDELVRFQLLIQAVWRRIMSLNLPDITAYDTTYKGILAFEADLIDEIDS